MCPAVFTVFANDKCWFSEIARNRDIFLANIISFRLSIGAFTTIRLAAMGDIIIYLLNNENIGNALSINK